MKFNNNNKAKGGRISLNTQLKKGALELCVLAQLMSKDQYGYELIEAISTKMSIASGTLYLILKRFKVEDYVETYLVESAEGPARKYYHITEKGIEYFHKLKSEWDEFVIAVSELVN